MNTELKEEIYQRYTHYLAGNYNEKYIYRLIIQEGYHQNDVDEVMKDIHTDKQRILKKKINIDLSLALFYTYWVRSSFLQEYC